jgi:DNA-binding NarL/FixJ family response regulator
MEPSRILLVDMPRMLREIIETALRSEADMAIVGIAGGNLSELRLDVDRAQPDVIVVGSATSDLLHRCCELLAVRPRLKVLAVSDNAREATFYELRTATHGLGELSPVDLVDAIRAARARRLTWSGA